MIRLSSLFLIFYTVVSISGTSSMTDNALTVDTDGVVYRDGFLGINTATPNHRLHVSGNAIIRGSAALSETNQSPSIFFGSGGWAIQAGTPFSGSPDSFAFVNRTSGSADISTSLFMTSAGNVGVGTSAPSSTLQFNRALTYLDMGHNSTLDWSNNPGGGLGDTAYIRYRSESDTKTTLEIGIENDNDDVIKFVQNGANRIIIDSTILGNSVQPQIKLSGGSSILLNSDRRLKKNIMTIHDPLPTLMHLNPVSYRWANDTASLSRKKAGLIAQETMMVLPEIVSKDDEGIYRLSYFLLLPLLVESFKAQEAEIDRLEAELSILENSQ